MTRGQAIRVLLLTVLCGGLGSGCAIVPLDGGHADSASIGSSPKSRIAQRLAQEGLPLPAEDSAVRLQVTGYQAWQDRLRLVQLADHSLDIQYFSWKDDESGLVLMSHVIDAADRGVRIRVLLDDMMAVNHAMLVRFDAHENIQVRLFNPFSTQRMDALVRPFEWLAKERVNVRMHNKVFVADGLVGMVGGRNIQNRYFWVDSSFNHRDLDAVVIGAVIPQLQSSFDEYWNSSWSVPMTSLEKAPKPRKVKKYYRALEELRESDAIVAQFAPATAGTLESYRISEGMLPARVEFFADPPDKVSHREPRKFTQLDALVDEQVDQELLIGTAYLVEMPVIMQQAQRLTERGAKISILTNSMVSIDFPAAFSGYVTIREALIDMGVDMYEFAVDATYPECPVSCIGTHMGYHSKLMVLDRKVSYVGSLNYDPRSIDINTEAGLVIYSEPVAQEVAAVFYEDAGTSNSWRVTHQSPMQWTRPGPDGELETRDDEPEANFINKLGVMFWGLIPLGDQY